MPSAASFDEQLLHLSDAIDEPGADLRAIVDLLLEDLHSAVDGFLGLDIILVIDGEGVSLGGIEPHEQVAARSSLRIPLRVAGSAPLGHITFFASFAHSLDSLADQAHRVHELPGEVVLERPPRSNGAPGVSRHLADRRTVDQAIGVLIARGHSPEEARVILESHAEVGGESIMAAADRLLTGLTP